MAKTKETQKGSLEIVKAKAESLLKLMGIEGTIEVNKDKENNSFDVNVEAGEANGLLIGRRGETLSALQFILSISLKDDLKEDGPRVLVNVGDWREKQEDYLKALATETAAKVKETGEDQ